MGRDRAGDDGVWCARGGDVFEGEDGVVAECEGLGGVCAGGGGVFEEVWGGDEGGGEEYVYGGVGAGEEELGIVIVSC